MLHALDVIGANPNARIFKIGDLLFAQFTCPVQEKSVGIWSHRDHMVHVLTSKSTWRTSKGTWSLRRVIMDG